MPGFSPVGSTPVAAIGGGAPVGTYFSPSAGVLTLTGNTLAFTTTPAQVDTVAMEVLHGGQPYARVSTVAMEVMRTIPTSTTGATVDTVAMEVLHGGQPYANVSLVAMEVMRTIPGVLAAPKGGRFVSILW